MDSLRITTSSEPAASLSVNNLPRLSGTPSVAKKPGVTALQPAERYSAEKDSPSSRKRFAVPSPLKGDTLVAPTESNSGDRASLSAASWNNATRRGLSPAGADGRIEIA